MRLKGIIENAAFIGAGVLSAFTLAGCGINQPSTKAACPSASSVKSGDITVAKAKTESGETVTVSMPADDPAVEFFCQTPYKITLTFPNKIESSPLDTIDAAASTSTSDFAQNLREMAATLADLPASTKAKLAITGDQVKLESISEDNGNQQTVAYTSPYDEISCNKTGRLNISCSTNFTANLVRSDLHVSDAQPSSWNYTLKFIHKILTL